MAKHTVSFEVLQEACDAEKKLRESGYEDAVLSGTNYHGEFSVEFQTDDRLPVRETKRLQRLVRPDSVAWNDPDED